MKIEIRKPEDYFTILLAVAIGLFLTFLLWAKGAYVLNPLVGLIYDEPPLTNAYAYCRKKENGQKTYCLNRAVAEREKWQSVVQESRGKPTAFSLSK